MKSTKQLQSLFNNVKGKHPDYYNFEDFVRNAKDFIKDVRTGKTYCHIDVSRSGMSRKFNFHNYNMLLNICYNNKFSWDAVNVGGCGMDMHWHLKFRACEELCTTAEIEKWHLNYACSSGITL